MDVVTHLERERETLQNFAHVNFFGSGSSGSTVDHRFFYLVLRGLRNYDSSMVSTSQIVVRTSKGVQKEPMFIFKI